MSSVVKRKTHTLNTHSLTASPRNQKKRKKEKDHGSTSGFAWHPLLGPTEVQVCRRHWWRIFVFSPPLGRGIQVYHSDRDGTVSSAAPLLHLSACTARYFPVWWISYLILLSWMIWGIIQKVSYFIYNYCVLVFYFWVEV